MTARPRPDRAAAEARSARRRQLIRLRPDLVEQARRHLAARSRGVHVVQVGDRLVERWRDEDGRVRRRTVRPGTAGGVR